MSTDQWRRCGSGGGRVVIAGLLMMLGACGGAGARRSDAERIGSGRLDGMWELTLRLDRRMSLSSTPATLPFTARGTVTMLANDRSDVSFASMAEPTEIGVYALRLDSLGLPSWQQGEVPTLAARERPSVVRTSVVRGDSILIVLNPGTPARVVRLAGVFADNVIRGEWTAASPLGGGGAFVMRRATPARVAAQ